MIEYIILVCTIIAACAAIWKSLGLQEYMLKRRKAKWVKKDWDDFIEEHNRPRVSYGGSIPSKKSKSVNLNKQEN